MATANTHLVSTLVHLLVFAVVVVGLYRQFMIPRRIISYGTVTAKARTGVDRTVTLRTRTVQWGSVRLEEVELPNGTWIDCQGDCAEAARREHLDFWQTQREQGQ